MAIINRTEVATGGFNEDALDTVLPHDVVLNFASLTTSGALAEGIYGEADGITATNSGSIETAGDGAAGIFIVGDQARVANLGTIMTSGSLYDAGGIPFTGDAIRIFGDRFQVLNGGEIDGSGFAPGGIVGVGSGGRVINLGQISVDGPLSAAIQTFGDSNAIRNAGEIAVDSSFFGFGVLAVGAGNDVVNSGEVRIDSAFLGFGMLIEGSHNQALNNGVISGSGYGVRGVFIGNGDDSHLSNAGSITVDGESSIGVLEFGFGVRISNSGTISVAGTGATAVALFGDGSELTNYGQISAPATAILAGELTQIILNHGQIIGDLQLGGGDDILVAGHGGKLDGIVALGAGDDLVIVDKGSGSTMIGDFQAGAGTDDAIDLSAFGFNDLNAVLAAGQQVGTDVVIALDGDDRLVLQNVAMTSLASEDFLFALHGTASSVNPVDSARSIAPGEDLQLIGQQDLAESVHAWVF